MNLIKKYIFLLAGIVPMTTNAALTLYTTNWSMYGSTPYEYDGAYKNGEPYGKLKYVKNPEMVEQFNKADVVIWSFMQIWNSKDPNQAQYQMPSSWDGLMHFDDLWSELPLEGDWVKPLPPETSGFLDFCGENEGACSSIQLNGNTNNLELLNYTDQKGVGQLNSFGAFINSNKYKAKRIIAIGGANTLENKGISTYTFEFDINYAADEITRLVLSYGIPSDKLQVGIAAYGRGYSGVMPGDDKKYPGLEQPWQGPSKFDKKYSNQDGLLPYKSLNKVVNDLNYKIYHIDAEIDNQSVITGSYIYNPTAKQFVGYQSTEVVKAICQYVKDKQLKGAIMWSADTDLPVSNSNSLVASYKAGC